MVSGIDVLVFVAFVTEGVVVREGEIVPAPAGISGAMVGIVFFDYSSEL